MAALRLTVQATPRNKFNVYWDEQKPCTGAAYTAASIASKLIAVALLPLYTRYLTPADYGAAEVFFAGVVAASIVIRFGLIEAVLRFYYKAGEDPNRVVATCFAALFWAATAGAPLRRRVVSWSGASRTRFPDVAHASPPCSAGSTPRS